jgi:hypothetical protein
MIKFDYLMYNSIARIASLQKLENLKYNQHGYRKYNYFQILILH